MFIKSFEVSETNSPDLANQRHIETIVTAAIVGNTPWRTQSCVPRLSSRRLVRDKRARSAMLMRGSLAGKSLNNPDTPSNTNASAQGREPFPQTDAITRRNCSHEESFYRRNMSCNTRYN